MNDFYTQYVSYSNTDLLKITSRPSLYQPAAVEAAEQILAARTVDQEDHVLAAAEIQEEERQANRHSAMISTVSQRFRSVMHYLFIPTSNAFDVQKWVYIMCIGLGLQYIWESVSSVNYLHFYLTCEACPFTVMEAVLAFSLVFAPVIIIFLLLKKKAGWTLAIFNSGFVVLLQLGFTFLNFLHLGSQILFPVLTILLHAALLRLLYKSIVREFFLASKKEFEKALVCATVIGAVTVLLFVYQV